MKTEITRESLNEAIQVYLAKGGKITKLDHSLTVSDEIYEMELASEKEEKKQIESLTGENYYPDQQMSVVTN